MILAVRFVLGRSEKLQLHRVQYNWHTLSEQIFKESGQQKHTYLMMMHTLASIYNEIESS